MGADRVGVPWMVGLRDRTLPVLSWVEYNLVKMYLPTVSFTYVQVNGAFDCAAWRVRACTGR